ncbi:MAG TPA: M15 family metallopeptidase, partial [Cellulomonas sp.]
MLRASRPTGRTVLAVVAALAVTAGVAACAPHGAPSPSPLVDAVPQPVGTVDPVAPADLVEAAESPAAVGPRSPVLTGDVTWPDLGRVEDGALATGYAGTVGPITAELAARMASSWREGCPVPLADLRYVTVTYRDVEGGTATGELVVHADVADSVVAVFAELFALGYPVRSMRLVDDFGGSDDASMAADNTSAFNCRAISRGTGWSEHAYGRAIDLNPRENPYVRGALVLPPEGEP